MLSGIYHSWRIFYLNHRVFTSYYVTTYSYTLTSNRLRFVFHVLIWLTSVEPTRQFAQAQFSPLVWTYVQRRQKYGCGDRLFLNNHTKNLRIGGRSIFSYCTLVHTSCVFISTGIYLDLLNDGCYEEISFLLSIISINIILIFKIMAPPTSISHLSPPSEIAECSFYFRAL